MEGTFISARELNKIDVLGVGVHAVTFDEALETVLGFLELSGADYKGPKTLFTPNPEFVMEARKNEPFRRTLNGGDLVVPDGVGVVLASRLGKAKLAQRVAGYDLIQALFARIKDTPRTVYFYGAKPGVGLQAKAEMERLYPGLKIIGCRDGYQDEAGMEDMICEIGRLKPDLLLVGLSFPGQELWIDRNKGRLPCKLIAGVGGSFDGMSGRVKRAPALFRRLGLEWLYRLLKQPSRFKRQLQLPLFMLIAVKERLFGKTTKGVGI